MRDPGAVVTGAHFADLVRPYLGQRRLVGDGIVLDRNLRRHAAHGMGAALMTGLDEQPHVRAQYGASIVTCPRSGRTKWGSDASVLMELKM